MEKTGSPPTREERKTMKAWAIKTGHGMYVILGRKPKLNMQAKLLRVRITEIKRRKRKGKI